MHLLQGKCEVTSPTPPKLSAKVHILRLHVTFLLCFFLCLACENRERKADNAAFGAAETGSEAGDLEHLQAAGELIVATLSGPDTYYEYQGRALGLQYALAEDFAATEGLRLRVEVERDTADLFALLREGKADLVCCQLPKLLIEAEGFSPAGACVDSLGTSWAVRPEASELAAALQEWYGRGVAVQVGQAEQKRRIERRTVHRKVRAPYINRERGIISTYDEQFRLAARAVGWDWRLIAAQCYQESGFDPNARSWAGACGLMQIMPATAAHLGLSQSRIYEPNDNIAAAARYLHELRGMFAAVRDREEQTKFVLAAYNAGPGHVQDAMALARKYGRNPHSWAEVSYYILHLSEARFYRDPVVKHGYMIGEETYNYVLSVWERWRAYGGSVVRMPGAAGDAGDGTLPNDGRRGQQRKPNKYTRDTKIYTPDDPEFFQIQAR